jgi:hypothetical protein
MLYSITITVKLGICNTRENISVIINSFRTRSTLVFLQDTHHQNKLNKYQSCRCCCIWPRLSVIFDKPIEQPSSRSLASPHHLRFQSLPTPACTQIGENVVESLDTSPIPSSSLLRHCGLDRQNKTGNFPRLLPAMGLFGRAELANAHVFAR